MTLVTAKDTTVLIPAAGGVPDGIVALSNISCPAMIPVAGRPVIHWTLGYLRKLGFRKFRIAIARRGMFIEEFVSCAIGSQGVDFIVPSSDRGVGGTVLELLEDLPTTRALVVLGDTYFEFADPGVADADEPVALVSEVEESRRWCLADATPDGHLLRLRDKEPGLSGDLRGLIGVYNFPDGNLAREVAAKASLVPGRIELATILDGVNEETPIRLLEAGRWVDVGNPDRQSAAHRALLAARHFNELSFDATFGTVTKRSANVEKFVDEITYLRLLPPDVAVLFPRVLDASTDWANPYVTMEYYGYPSLSDAFLFENVDEGIWRRVFEHLYAVLDSSMWQHRRPLRAADVQAMYLDKPRTRLSSIAHPTALVNLIAHAGPIRVNDEALTNLPALWPKLETAVDALTETAEATIVHGDLCLSNILYDLRAKIVKLIDPRGSFGGSGIFGDPRYDVAKLYHSVYGLYDCIVNDLFEADASGSDIRLDIRSQTQHEAIRVAFEAVFFERFDRREILLITGLIFASLPALHDDSPPRQIAMYARSLQLINEALT